MFMIERMYGNSNKDWLAYFGWGDDTTTWVCGSKRALIVKTKAEALKLLEAVKAAAAKWDTKTDFRFAVIRDRSAKPSYFGSTYINPYIDDDEPSCYPPNADRERFNCRQ